MTSPEPSGTARSTDVADVEAALTAGRVTADEPQARAVQTFALAVRGAQPPARPAFLEALDRWMQDELRQSAPTTAPEAARRPIRVCVVEPHPLVREGMIRTLQRASEIEVVGQAGDGLAAMELARRLEPDVMVLNLRLPSLSGMQVLERLHHELPPTRTLVVTMDDSPESLLDAVEAGAAGYLSTETSGEELCRGVITVHDGGSVIAPEFAARTVREIRRVEALVRAEEFEAVRRRLAETTRPIAAPERALDGGARRGARWWTRWCLALRRGGAP